MSENTDSDYDDLGHTSHKEKRHALPIKDSDSSRSDSSIEKRVKRRKPPKVTSEAEESDSSLEMITRSKKVPRVDSGSETSSSSYEESENEESDDGVEEENEESSYDSESGSSFYVESDGAGEEEEDAPTQTVAQNKSPVKPEPVVSSGICMSDSSDGQSEKCPICLRSFTTQEVGTPESCDHSFCADCLKEWSNNVNTCPVDRQMFTLILVRRRLEGKVIRKIPVETRKPQEEDEEIQEDPTYCEVCGRCDREDRMLLCDGCDLGYHLECLNPPMDTVPVEEWFCLDCVLANAAHLAESVDMDDGEVPALMEDAAPLLMSPLRPRRPRMLPRTLQSERVRANIQFRHGERHQSYPMDPTTLPSTSSGIESLDSNASGTTTRCPGVQPARTIQRRRKVTRKRVKRRKSTQKRKTTKKRTIKKTVKTKSAKLGEKKTPSKRRKTRKKKKVKKRKTTLGRRTRTARVIAPQSAKGRIAEHLGMRPLRRPGQTIPEVRSKTVPSAIDLQRSRAGIPTLHIFGQRDQLDYFSSGSDVEGGGEGGDVITAPRRRVSANRLTRGLINRKLLALSPSALQSHSALPRATVDSPCDLVSSILDSQQVWHSRKSVMTINRDGSLQVKPDNSLAKLSGDNTPLNLVDPDPGHVTQAPMYPGRGNGGGSRPPAGTNLHQYGGRYGDSPSYQGYQGGRGYSNFPSPSGFDSRGSRTGYTNYLNSGAPAPFRGGPPIRFRMSPRYPLRRPQQRLPQLPPTKAEEFTSDPVPEDTRDDEEIDIYSDIEVGGGPGEPEDLTLEPLLPQAQSDDDQNSDSELIIDDNMEVPESDKYDPAEPSADTDDEAESLMVAPPPPQIGNNSSSSASYLHSPTYGAPTEYTYQPQPLKAKEDSPGDGDDEEEEPEVPNFSIYSAASMDIARTNQPSPDKQRPCSVDPVPADSPCSLERPCTDSPCSVEPVPADSPCSGEPFPTDSPCSVEPVPTDSPCSLEPIPADSPCSVEPIPIDSPSSLEPPRVESPCRMESVHAESPCPDEGSPNNLDQTCKDKRGPVESEDKDFLVDLGASSPGSVSQGKAGENDKKVSLVEEIFGSDDDSLIGGATSAVSAATLDNTPQPAAPVGLEGLETETISETEEAINFEDDLSLDETGFMSEEDGEIPTRRKKKRSHKLSDRDKDVKNRTPPDPIDYEEGEIVDDRPKTAELAKKDKTSDKKDKSKYEKENHKKLDENTDITKGKVSSTDGESKKKKKKSSNERNRQSKDRPVLGSNENKDKNREKLLKLDDSNISWKKPSKSSKERNYRDGKVKESNTVIKEKDSAKKSSSVKDSSAKRDKKRKEKRKDMERYDVRKIVTDKKRKRRDEFGRDLSRDRSYTRTRSRSLARRSSYDKLRGRSRSLSRTAVNRSRGRVNRSRSRSRIRSRSRSRNRSRSKSKSKYKLKSKDKFRRSRSRDKGRGRLSRDRSRGKRSRTKSRSKTPRMRQRSRSRSLVRSRDVKDRSRPVAKLKNRVKEKRSWTHSWTPSWSHSRSRSISCSSCSRSPSLRRFNRSYSGSFSRSWSRERNERIPVINKKSGTMSKTAKKLTVIVTNTKDDSERQRKKEKKRKETKKIKEPIEKRKKRKEKSPAPSKEVFTSGDNILVSVNFNKSNKTTGKDSSNITGPASMATKESNKRKHEMGYDPEPVKKSKKDKGNKDKTGGKGSAAADRSARAVEKRNKKGLKLSPRVAAVINKKPVAIIDLDQSPFREQTPSPRDLIVLSDSDDEARNKEEQADNVSSRRGLRQPSSSPKTGPIACAEAQSPPMSAIMSYLVTSTGPKTPPEPQIKFSISSKPQLRAFNNPLQEEDEEMLGEEGAMDEMDQRIEEELDRGLGEMLQHKGPNTPPEPRGPTTPCSPPTSPDAYDPFDPTKSGTPSPAEPCTMPASPEPPQVHLSPAPSDQGKADVKVPTPLLELAVEDLNKSPRPDPGKSPSILVEPTLPMPSDTELTQPPQTVEDQPMETSTPAEPSLSPERKIAVVITTQTTPAKQQLFPIINLKQPPPTQAPVTSTPSHSAAPTPVFPTLTSSNIATMLRAPPPSALPLSRVNLFSQPPPSLPHHHHLLGSPIVVQQRPPKLTPEKMAPSSRPSAVQNGDQPKLAVDTSTDVVDMELESPYSPGSSEGDDLFEPPTDHSKGNYAARQPAKNCGNKLPAPQHKSPNKAHQEKFDFLFGSLPRAKPAALVKRQVGKTHHPKAGKMKQHKTKGGKKEIIIKMDEDQLQILDELPSSAVELQVKDKFLKKLNRQERVVEEVKLSLKPHYTKKHISKDEYKDILRRSVPKICHNKSGEINPVKISTLVEAYVRKYRYTKKKNSAGLNTAAAKPKVKTTMWS